jgi:hypothetical protein
LQWIVYRLAGGQWRAVSFPTTRTALLITLRERVSDRYATHDGIDPDALATIQAFPEHFSAWRDGKLSSANN